MHLPSFSAGLVTALLGAASVQASPAPATATKAPAAAKNLFKNPSFETAQLKNGTGAANWVSSSSALVVRKVDKSAQSGKAYISLSTNPSISNESYISQVLSHKELKTGTNYTLNGYYRVKNYSGHNDAGSFGLFYIGGSGRLAHRMVFRASDEHWKPFTAKIPDPFTYDYQIDIVASASHATFAIDFDNLSFEVATTKGAKAKNSIAAVPLAQFSDPSFEVASNSTPFAAGWSQAFDPAHAHGIAGAHSSGSAHNGQRVMRLSVAENQVVAVSTALPYLDLIKEYNVSCWTRLLSKSALGKARLELQVGDNKNTFPFAYKLFANASLEWSLFSGKLGIGGYGDEGFSGRGVFKIAATHTAVGNASFVAEVDSCSISLIGFDKKASAPWV